MRAIDDDEQPHSHGAADDDGDQVGENFSRLACNKEHGIRTLAVAATSPRNHQVRINNST
jgi:hypothetical protein